MSNTIDLDGQSLDPIDAVSAGRLQLLVFSASWCGPCKAMAPAIEDIAQSYADEVVVAKIDIEASPELAQAFQVRGVPALVMRRGDTVIDRHVGGLTRTRLSLVLDDALARGDPAA